MNTIDIYFESKKTSLPLKKWTARELMVHFKLSPERVTLFKKQIGGYHEFSIEELDLPLDISENNHFGVFDKAPTYNA